MRYLVRSNNELSIAVQETISACYDTLLDAIAVTADTPEPHSTNGSEESKIDMGGVNEKTRRQKI